MNPIAIAFFLLASIASSAGAQNSRDLIEASLRKHALPSHVYEEQALLMTDRHGKLTVRTVRSYMLRDDHGSRNLKVIETPADAKGAAIYIVRDFQGREHRGLAATSPAFGSNFTIADLEAEQTSDFRYELEGDQVLDRVRHHVLRAVPVDESVVRRTGYHQRRLYLRKDNLFISRIEYQDRHGRQIRRQTFRDPSPDDSGAWRPRMVLMEDLRDGERTLLKVEHRVHSSDYVPAGIFAGLRTIQ
jgi:hypothetical protein